MQVRIEIPAIRVEELQTGVNTTIETETPTRVVISKDVTENPNFDHYLQPKADLLYDYAVQGEFSYGGETFQRTNAMVEIEFDCYADQLRKAAQKRAAEDWCHEVHVLAEWTHRAESNNHDVADELQRALDMAADDNPDAEYRKEIGGGADLMEDTTNGTLDGNEVEL